MTNTSSSPFLDIAHTALLPLNKWMSKLSKEYDDESIAKLSIPGTHDSCAIYDGGAFGFIHTQMESITWQLNNGIRYLDIRVKLNIVSIEQIHLYPAHMDVYHGHVYQGTSLGEVFKTCFDFLTTNKRETIIMRVQREGSGDDDMYIEAFNNLLDLNNNYTKIWLGTRLPTLNEARGVVVLLCGDPYIDKGLYFYDMQTQDVFSNPPLDTKKTAITDHLIASNTSDGIANLYINHLSATGAGFSTWTPWHYAQVMNPFVLNKLRSNEYLNKTQLGVIVYDYAGASTAVWNRHDNLLAKAIIGRNKFEPLTL